MLLDIESHPTWVCGLKLTFIGFPTTLDGVTPYVGVWIETAQTVGGKDVNDSHTLRGCVD